MDLTEYLRSIISPLLKHPDEAVITHSTDDRGVLLTLELHSEDMGIVIGRGGETARAIRTIVKFVGICNNARISVKILGKVSV